MILLGLFLILVVGGLIAWLTERWHPLWPRIIALLALGFDLLWIVLLWLSQPGPFNIAGQGAWLAQLNWPWITRFGIRFHLALDGLSLLLVLLTCFLGLITVAASWSEIKHRVGFFHFNVLWTLAGVLGVFMALDLFLFFLFWELMLVPMYFLIAIWGHEHRLPASFKFFLFTQGSGLLLLIAILTLVWSQFQHSGVLTFNYFDLLGASLTPTAAFWSMLGFFIAFTVKLPAVPFHPWLPDAHTQASAGGSIILAGILLKTGAYGLLRFVLPLFPEAATDFTPIAMLLGVIGILYGAGLAFVQHDLKRLIAYTSVSHMGFVLLGIFAGTPLALQGAVIQILAHGMSTPALFMVAGVLQERLHTRDMRQMSGLWSKAPRLAAIGLFFALASLGLPGLGNFVGEFLILLGTYPVSTPFTAIAALGLILAAVYALLIVQKVFHGKGQDTQPLPDFSIRHMTAMSAMILILLWLGLYPQPVFDMAYPALESLHGLSWSSQ
ncbi:NADH-quinone oxidoreductase subunit M [Nitrosococcus watsonii]|uniref:NADH-quinone oxidoreductase subunit M n=1 Tax=Nitrosococcus watsoni (strain C-113) TaxID=105559 RepID=D8K781_NITWC|nr:NADH-quinone oxidoreductase subunit M [Nitrosococcus watsonii]ADJ28758.1 proton-translocating NADH-quinone oxidoreductase, chain M [Nitrosococcus watsonii C-113]